MGTGTWRFGQGPADQNSGLFNLKNLNQFFRKVSDTGTEAHQDFAKASMVFYTEEVLKEAILEAPIEFSNTCSMLSKRFKRLMKS